MLPLRGLMGLVGLLFQWIIISRLELIPAIIYNLIRLIRCVCVCVYNRAVRRKGHTLQSIWYIKKKKAARASLVFCNFAMIITLL